MAPASCAVSTRAPQVTPGREAELQNEIASLPAEIASLRHDIADLRASPSATLWKDLHEAAIRRCEELEREHQS